MNKKQQPEALQFVEMTAVEKWQSSVTLVSYARECVAELLRQHAENETLRVGYAAARLEIESLKAQLHAAKQINAAQFGLLAASIPGSALRASHGQAPAQTADSQLLQFYGVTTDAELIAAQAAHIEKLQAKLTKTPSFAPQRVREG